MNIKEFYTLDTAELTVINPKTYEPTDIRIEILSPDSFAYKKVLIKMSKKFKDKLNSSESILDDEANLIDFLVAVTKSWKNVELDHQALECTEENVRHVYTHCSDIREQVNVFLGNKANFLVKA